MSTIHNSFSEDEQEYLAEREAIAEYDGGLTRKRAAELDYSCYNHKYWPEYKSYYPLRAGVKQRS